MTTAPSTFHQWIVRRLDRLVGIPLEDQAFAYVFTAPIGVLMPDCDPVQQIFLVRQANAAFIRERRIRGIPDLIAEVVAPSNAEQDTKIKRAIYAHVGVPEYWLVRPATRDVLRCSQPDTVLAIMSIARCLARRPSWSLQRCRCAYPSPICSLALPILASKPLFISCCDSSG